MQGANTTLGQPSKPSQEDDDQKDVVFQESGHENETNASPFASHLDSQ